MKGEFVAFLIIDAPQSTYVEKKEYNYFVKEIHKRGYFRIQNSVFVKACGKDYNFEVEDDLRSKILPSDIKLALFKVTDSFYKKKIRKINCDVNVLPDLVTII